MAELHYAYDPALIATLGPPPRGSDHTAEERLDYLIRFLEHLPSSNFDMTAWFQHSHRCGTVGCIGGWIEALFFDYPAFDEDDCADAIGLGPLQAEPLFYMEGTEHSMYSRSAADAARVLRLFKETGRIDWGAAIAAGQEAGHG